MKKKEKEKNKSPSASAEQENITYHSSRYVLNFFISSFQSKLLFKKKIVSNRAI